MKNVQLQFKSEEFGEFHTFLSVDEFEHFYKFNQSYFLKRHLYGGVKIVLGQNVANPKKCRFCGKQFPDATFNKIAHVITQQWNRAKPISKFECDNCNDKFSKYESDFGHYFLLDRSLFAIKKKKGNPKYKSKAGAMLYPVLNLNDKQKINKRIKEIVDERNASLISIHLGENENEIAINNEVITINLKRKPYRPINVFKVFLKMGLSLLDETELEQYSTMFNLLNNEISIETKDEFSAQELCLIKTEFPVLRTVFKYPILYLFEKNTDKLDFADKTLVVYFCNKIYQIPILSDKNIRHIYQEKKNLKILRISPFINPYFSKEMFEDKDFRKCISDSSWITKNLYKSELENQDFQRLEIIGMKDLI